MTDSILNKENLNLSSIVIRLEFENNSFYLWVMQKLQMKKQELG